MAITQSVRGRPWAGLLLGVLLVSSALGAQNAKPAQAAAEGPLHFRLLVSENVTVFGRVSDKELRLATSLEALDKAAAVKANTGQNAQTTAFPATPLPLSAEQMPATVSAIRLEMAVIRAAATGGHPVARAGYGVLTFEREKAVANAAKPEKWSFGARVSFVLSDDPDAAVAVPIPDLSKLRINLVTTYRNRQLGIAVAVMLDKLELADLRKGGQPNRIKVSVLDEKGKIVASKAGVLQDFGYG